MLDVLRVTLCFVVCFCILRAYYSGLFWHQSFKQALWVEFPFFIYYLNLSYPREGSYLLKQSDIFAVCLLDSLELELSGELVLSLLQLLSAPHMLVIHVLDLRLNALELGIQLQGERERHTGWGGTMSRCSRWWTGQLAAAWLSVATALEALASGEMGSQ